jgi:hypothetical protein
MMIWDVPESEVSEAPKKILSSRLEIYSSSKDMVAQPSILVRLGLISSSSSSTSLLIRSLQHDHTANPLSINPTANHADLVKR